MLLLLTPAERELVFNTMKDTLPSLVASAHDFSKIAEPLSREQRKIFFDSIKPRLSALVRTKYDADYIQNVPNARREKASL